MFNIGLENGTEGRSQAWVLGHPGCFAYGKDGSAALLAVRQAIQEYRLWIADHTSERWLDLEADKTLEYQLEETWECYNINNESWELDKDGIEINAWFRHDWIPLSGEDIRRGRLLLDWGRQELMKIVANLSPAQLERTYPQERWSIAGILQHIGGAEWWYMDRLGLAFDRKAVPGDPIERLAKVRSRLITILPGLAGSKTVVGVNGEIWSPRKLLRRAVWHEYDHIAHIRKLL